MYALGFVSVFDQILDGFEGPDKTNIFNAYIQSLGEDPATYRVSENYSIPAECFAAACWAAAMHCAAAAIMLAAAQLGLSVQIPGFSSR